MQRAAPRSVQSLSAAYQRDIASDDDGLRFRTAWERLLSDAGGELPDYRGGWDKNLPDYGSLETDALGRPKRGSRLP